MEIERFFSPYHLHCSLHQPIHPPTTKLFNQITQRKTGRGKEGKH